MNEFVLYRLLPSVFLATSSRSSRMVAWFLLHIHRQSSLSVKSSPCSNHFLICNLHSSYSTSGFTIFENPSKSLILFNVLEILIIKNVCVSVCVYGTDFSETCRPILMKLCMRNTHSLRMRPDPKKISILRKKKKKFEKILKKNFGQNFSRNRFFSTNLIFQD